MATALKPKRPLKIAEDRQNDAYVLDDQIGFVLRLAVQYHTAIFTSRMVENLTQTQFAALAKIYETRSCSQSDLVKLLTLDSATVNGVVDRLNSRGLVTMTDDPFDRRRQSITLTKAGTALAKKSLAVAAGITEETVSRLTASEQLRLTHLLRKMMGTRPLVARS